VELSEGFLIENFLHLFRHKNTIYLKHYNTKIATSPALVLRQNMTERTEQLQKERIGLSTKRLEQYWKDNV
jgi:hypothetical protein